MKSPAGLELLGRARIVGWPTLATPWNTVSTKLGLAFVPNLALKIWMQFGPHCGVAAVAESVPTVLRPAATVSVATTASTFLVMDMTSSFLESRPSLRTAVVLALDSTPTPGVVPRVPPGRERPFLPGLYGLMRRLSWSDVHQQRLPIGADDRMQAQLTDVEVPAGARVVEPRRDVRRPGDGAGAFRGGRMSY